MEGLLTFEFVYFALLLVNNAIAANTMTIITTAIMIVPSGYKAMVGLLAVGVGEITGEVVEGGICVGDGLEVGVSVAVGAGVDCGWVIGAGVGVGSEATVKVIVLEFVVFPCRSVTWQ
jgi:hypothetical protein